MKRLLCFFVLSSLVSVGEERFGTVIIAMGSPQEIVLGADSRQTVIDATGKHTHDDNHCKISTFNGRFAFAAAGKSGLLRHDGASTWDVNTVARDVSRKLGPRATLEQIASEWGKEVSALDGQDFERGVNVPHEGGHGQEGLFVGYVGGAAVSYIVTNFQIENGSYVSRTKKTDLTNEMPFVFGGDIDIAAEFVSQQTARSQTWMKEFAKAHPERYSNGQLVQWLVEKTIEFSEKRDSIGGPVDVVAVSPSAIHWVQKKQNCPE